MTAFGDARLVSTDNLRITRVETWITINGPQFQKATDKKRDYIVCGPKHVAEHDFPGGSHK